LEGFLDAGPTCPAVKTHSFWARGVAATTDAKRKGNKGEIIVRVKGGRPKGKKSCSKNLVSGEQTSSRQDISEGHSSAIDQLRTE